MTGKADKEGRWKLKLEPMKASAEGRSLEISSGDKRVEIQDVLVGDVWFAGGQSNMDYKVNGMARRLAEGKALADEANYPAIRHRKVNERNAAVPQSDLNGGSWVVCYPKDRARVFGRGLCVRPAFALGAQDSHRGDRLRLGRDADRALCSSLRFQGPSHFGQAGRLGQGR